MLVMGESDQRLLDLGERHESLVELRAAREPLINSGVRALLCCYLQSNRHLQSHPFNNDAEVRLAPYFVRLTQSLRCNNQSAGSLN